MIYLTIKISFRIHILQSAKYNHKIYIFNTDVVKNGKITSVVWVCVLQKCRVWRRKLNGPFFKTEEAAIIDLPEKCKLMSGFAKFGDVDIQLDRY